MSALSTLFLIFFKFLAAPGFAQQQFGFIGDLELASGGVLRDCRVGYRTFEEPNAEKSNVILCPTWANDRTEQMEGVAVWLGDAGYFGGLTIAGTK